MKSRHDTVRASGGFRGGGGGSRNADEEAGEEETLASSQGTGWVIKNQKWLLHV